MAVTINASTTTGLVQSADTSGIITLQNNGTNAVTITSGNLQFNSGYGSVATAYGCRAWVNFNGQGTVAIRGSGNVTSITDNGTGNYTVNFTTAMPDANYSVAGSTVGSGNGGRFIDARGVALATGSCQLGAFSAISGTLEDTDCLSVQIFR